MRRVALALSTVVLVSATVAAQSGYINVDLYSLGGYGYMSPRAADVREGKPFKSTIPPAIKALSGRKVRIDGFMIPYEQAAMRTSEFMLVGSYDSCGFGDMPSGMTDWVHVSLPKGQATTYTTDPVVVTGVLDVGEDFDKNGFVTSVYRLEADGVR